MTKIYPIIHIFFYYSCNFFIIPAKERIYYNLKAFQFNNQPALPSKLQKLLHSLEKDQKIFWNISPATGKFLNLLIKERKFKTILEIGTSNGYSGIWMAEATKSTKGHLYTIESNYKKRFHLAKENFKKSGLSKRIIQILGHAPEAIPKTPGYFDLAFFDATKEEHLQYFQAIKNRIKKGGMIIADNTISHKKTLLPFIRAIKSNKNWFSVALNFENGLLISLKIA